MEGKIMKTLREQFIAKEIENVYGIERRDWRQDDYDTDCSNPYNVEITSYHATYEEAWQQHCDDVKNTTAEFGEVYEISVATFELSDIEKDNIAVKLNEDEDCDIEYAIKECVEGDYEIDDTVAVEYDYPSIEGALLIEWNWHMYLGYARNFEGVREGYYGETKSICVAVESTAARQVSILLSKEEMEDDALSKEDKVELAMERVSGMDKWTCSYDYIRRSIEEYLN